MIFFYHLILFTDFIGNSQTKYDLGYSFLGFVCFQIFVNVAFIAYELFKEQAFEYHKKQKKLMKDKQLKEQMEKKIISTVDIKLVEIKNIEKVKVLKSNLIDFKENTSKKINIKKVKKVNKKVHNNEQKTKN